jgi:DUF1680 family protein
MTKTVDFSQTKVTGGFWKQKQDMIRKTTIYAVYDRFVETGRFDAFKFNWKPGMPNQPHIFWDSDVAKWIEGVGYLLHYQRDEALEALVALGYTPNEARSALSQVKDQSDKPEERIRLALRAMAGM